MEEKKDQVMELTTEVETESTDEVSVDTDLEIIDLNPESNETSGKLVAGVVAGIAALTAGAVFLYKRHKKKKANEQDEKSEDSDEDDEEYNEDDTYDVEATEEAQDSDEQPEQSQKDKKRPTKK